MNRELEVLREQRDAIKKIEECDWKITELENSAKFFEREPERKGFLRFWAGIGIVIGSAISLMILFSMVTFEIEEPAFSQIALKFIIILGTLTLVSILVLVIIRVIGQKIYRHKLELYNRRKEKFLRATQSKSGQRKQKIFELKKVKAEAESKVPLEIRNNLSSSKRILDELIGYFTSGRADTYKEAINLHYARIEREKLAADESRKQQAFIGALASAYSSLSKQQDEHNKIIESEAKRAADELEKIRRGY